MLSKREPQQRDGRLCRFRHKRGKQIETIVANGVLTAPERTELTQLRQAADCFMLRKAYAVDLLRWRGYAIPPAHQLKPLP